MPPSERIPLAGPWRFAIDPDNIGEQAGWTAAHFDASAWQEVTVPHTWNFTPEHTHYEGFAWYRRAFTCPLEAKENHLRLHFDAVFYLARVWLNGQYLGAHEGGYTPFEFDVSDQVQPGILNVISVQVDNFRSTDRLPAHLYDGSSYGWHNCGGIVRDIWLILTNQVFIAAQRAVAVPHLTGINEADRASISVSVTLRNASGEPFAGRVSARIFDEATGQTVLSVPSTPVDLAASQDAQVSLEAVLPKPKLWHFDHPKIYRFSARLTGDNGEEIHTDEFVFGIRLVELKEGCFFLNGEVVRLAGLSRHASVPGHGLAENEAVMKTAFDDLKSLNMVCQWLHQKYARSRDPQTVRRRRCEV